MDAELPRNFLLGCSAKTIEPLHDAPAGESDAPDRIDEFCLLQSTGHSPGPVIYAAADRLREIISNHDADQQESPAGLKHPRYIPEGLLLIGSHPSDVPLSWLQRRRQTLLTHIHYFTIF